MWNLIARMIDRDAALAEKPLSYLSIWLVRISGMCALVVVVKIAFVWDGWIPDFDSQFVASLVLALLAIVLSGAFFVGNLFTSNSNSAYLHKLLDDIAERTARSDARFTPLV